MCELAGLRVRFPFLNDAIVAFSATIPPELLVEGGRLRGFYKEALSDFLPREILAKKKKGFGLPYLELVHTYKPLNQLVCDSLQSLKKRSYFRCAFLASSIVYEMARDSNHISSIIRSQTPSPNPRSSPARTRFVAESKKAQRK